jgi:hypothetical protein
MEKRVIKTECIYQTRECLEKRIAELTNREEEYTQLRNERCKTSGFMFSESYDAIETVIRTCREKRREYDECKKILGKLLKDIQTED